MSRLISISIDVTKIPRERIVAGKNGGKYIDLDVWINDDPDKYGNDAGVSIRQTKEERESKARKLYIGNGKKVFGWDDNPQQQGRQQSSAQHDDDDGEIPF